MPMRTQGHASSWARVAGLSSFLPSWTTVVWLSSLVLRAFSYIFLRWIPGHHIPPVVFVCLVLYALGSYRTGRASTTGSRVGGDGRAEQAGRTGKKSAGHADKKGESNGGLEEYSGASMARMGEARRRRRSRHSALRALLTGIPDRSIWLWSAVTVSVNVVLACIVFDMVLRAPLLYPSHDLSFARVGYVDEESAKVLVREPDLAKLPVELSYRAESESQWMTAAAVARALSNETDYTHAWTLQRLQSSTDYLYSTSNGHSGSFRTGPQRGRSDPKSSKLTFLTTSCIKPCFPYTPFSHPLSIPGLDHLARLIPHLHASFMLFLGDFIYVDVPFRFGYGAANYRREYRQVYASPSWAAASASLPWLHVIDDHEIANDWDAGDSPPYPAAIDPFNIYHHAVNPPPTSPNASYYTFRHGPASFFLLDTRRYCSTSSILPVTDPSKTMLGSKQLDAVRAWLGHSESDGVRWKILVSSVPFTRNWRVNSKDTWAGYLAERQIVLEAMWDAASGGSPYGIVVLSGDRHEFAATRFPAPSADDRGQYSSSTAPPALNLSPISGIVAGSFVGNESEADRSKGPRVWPPGTAVHEFSCSPLSMFYLPLRSYWEVEGEQSNVGTGGEDQKVAYIPEGNSKFGAVEIENAVSGTQGVLRYRLFVDGRERWSYVLTAG